MSIGPVAIIAILAIVLVVFEAFNSKTISPTQIAVILLALLFIIKF